MSRIIRLVIMSGLMGLLLTPLLGAQSVTVLTETFPPFSYEEHGRVTGIATQRIEAILREAGIAYEIEVEPWSRAYRRARTGRDILLYSVGRTPDRESDFFWIGPLLPLEIAVYAPRDRDIHISSLEALRGYRIGVVRDDMRDQLFRALGSFQLVRFRNSADLLRALDRGTVDLVPLATLTVPVLLEQLRMPPDGVRQVFSAPELQQSDLYLVAGRRSDPELVERLQRAWERVVGTP